MKRRTALRFPIVGIAVATMSIICGLFIGLMAGYFRKVDAVVMRKGLR